VSIFPDNQATAPDLFAAVEVWLVRRCPLDPNTVRPDLFVNPSYEVGLLVDPQNDLLVAEVVL
jgi:hypothetical protein